MPFRLQSDYSVFCRESLLIHRRLAVWLVTVLINDSVIPVTQTGSSRGESEYPASPPVR
ncbi:MAG: hypothetical protein ACRC46_06455 [Thermoguttaceae bacterium]